jgi:phosphoenolpyruvate synthase/pyruvate phosphate dikinase
MLTRMRAKDVIVYGTKASNLGEIVTANLPGVRVPMGFGVPFYYFDQHMKRNHLTEKVDAMLADPSWQKPEWRKTALEQLQKQIMDAPIDPDLLDAVYKRVRVELGGKGVFVRSSSNSEDLPGFNGAGLYDTRGNVVGKQQLADALRYVWASIWNLRAVAERDAYGIDHKQVYMGVLVQIGINATAAGVLVTKDIFDPTDDHSFTINAKWGLGERVVQGQKSPEQIVWDPTNDGTKIIARSDDPVMLKFDPQGGLVEQPVPPGQDVILTEVRAKKLGTMVQAFQPVFARGVPLDVEWVLEGEDIWIVQSRPYVGQ